MQYFVFLGGVIVSIVLYYNAPDSMNKSFMSFCLAIDFFLILKHIRGVRNDSNPHLRGVYLKHSVFFLFAFTVVFFQINLDYVIGLIDSSDQMIWINNRVVAKSLALSGIALSSLLMGYYYYRTREKQMSDSNYIYLFKNKKNLCYVGYFLLFIYLYTEDSSFLQGGYARGAESGSGFIIMVMLQSVFIAILTMYGYEKNNVNNELSNKREFILPISLIALYVLIIVMTGRRGEAIRMASMLFVFYIYMNSQRINYTRVLMIGFAAALLFSFVGIIRQIDSGGASNSFYELLAINSVSPMTRELAGSVNTLHAAVDAVPNSFPYNYGLTFLPSFSILVPGLDRLVRGLIYQQGIFLNSGDFITWYCLGDDPAYGMGTDVIADVYISFGMIGVLVVFYILGMFFRYIEVGLFSKNKSPYFIAMSLCCYSQLFYICRGTLSSLFLSWSYAAILLFIFSKSVVKNRS